MRSKTKTQTYIQRRKAIRTFGPRPLRFYGNGIAYLNDSEIKGRLVVIEGPDASGRSTQIGSLTSHLEASGHAVINTGFGDRTLLPPGF